MRLFPWIGAALLSAAFGCSPAPAEEPAGTPSPDASVDGAPPDLGPVIVHPGFITAKNQVMTLLSDGDPIVVRVAPQGGQVIWAGGRVKGLAPGPALVDAKLIDPDTSEVVVHDWRPVQLVSAGDGSGELQPDTSDAVSFAHLLACPNLSDRPMEGVEWILRVQYAEPENEAHSGDASVRVVPQCAAGPRQEQCQCECAAGYTAGKCAPP